MASAEFSFKKYQVENGLSHNTTWCAIQDSFGFLWIGTSNGLNCYYGSGNKIYRNVLNDKYFLGNNFVGSLMEEGEDLWIGTSSGLYIYDRSIQKIIRLINAIIAFFILYTHVDSASQI